VKKPSPFNRPNAALNAVCITLEPEDSFPSKSGSIHIFV